MEIYRNAFAAAVCVSIIACLIIFVKKKNRLNIAVIATFISLFFLFYPNEYLKGYGIFGTHILSAFYHAIRVFTLSESVFSDLVTPDDIGQPLYNIYILYATLLYIAAPVLTAGFIIRAFSRCGDLLFMYFNVKKETFVFSSMNDNSVLMAKSINRLYGDKAKIVFLGTDITEKSRFDLGEARVITNNKPITAFDRNLILKASKITFLFEDIDEKKNLNETITMIEKINADEKIRRVKGRYINMLSFTSLPEAEPTLNSLPENVVFLRRINKHENVIFNYFINNPVCSYVNEKKELNVVIVGLGKYGTAILKALIWTCQGDGIKLNISVFDVKPITDSFAAQYPELVYTDALPDKKYINYNLKFYDNTDVLETEISNIKDPVLNDTSIVFVSMGDKEEAFSTAIFLRESFARSNCSPKIIAVTKEVESRIPLTMKNYKGIDYNIDWISENCLHTYDQILDKKLERLALDMFHRWNSSYDKVSDDDFYNYEFNFRSSIAAAMFWLIRKNKGLDISLSDENLELEHIRWCAYMRTEGFRYSENRNDLAKLHPCLIPWNDLSENMKQRDGDPIKTIIEYVGDEENE